MPCIYKNVQLYEYRLKKHSQRRFFTWHNEQYFTQRRKKNTVNFGSETLMFTRNIYETFYKIYTTLSIQSETNC